MVAVAVFENGLHYKARLLVGGQTHLGTSQLFIDIVNEDVLFLLFLCIVQHALNLHDIANFFICGMARTASMAIHYTVTRNESTSFLPTWHGGENKSGHSSLVLEGTVVVMKERYGVFIFAENWSDPFPFLSVVLNMETRFTLKIDVFDKNSE